jgi:hypothetical protein
LCIEICFVKKTSKEIREKMEQVLGDFEFEVVAAKERRLLEG